MLLVFLNTLILIILFIYVYVISYLNIKLKKFLNYYVYESQNSESPLELINKNGYPCEIHAVQTRDAYILNLYRIPHGKNKKYCSNPIPILMHHGLLSSSIDWIIKGPQESLAYQLADLGFDVWMANCRGNKFSKGNKIVCTNDKKYWNFSFHEMGIYDLPSSIDYILDKTNSKKIIYIGHSLGTTIFFVMTSMLPEYNNKIFLNISLAPVTAIPNSKSDFRFIVPFANILYTICKLFGYDSFLEHDFSTKYLMKYVCDRLLLFCLWGKNIEQFDKKIVPIIYNNIPAGTSIKTMVHCSQLISNGVFSNFNYGHKKNKLRYGVSLPPEYNLSNVTTPTKIYYSENDIISTPKDVLTMYSKLPVTLGLTKIRNKDFNHVDFIWGKNINELLNNDIIEFLKKTFSKT